MAWTDEDVRTERLVLRPAVDADKPVLVELLTDLDVRAHLGGPVDDATIEQFRSATVGERSDAFVVERLADGAVVGAVHLDRERGELEVSYQFVTAVWGRGIAKEAVGALLEWAWSSHDDASVIAVTQTANERSVRLLERLGFAVEATFEEFGADQSQFRLDRPR